ncbi:iron chelate uptake ABC transporter family permease subunit [Ornithinibacillus sp. L9]|uniref:Iron chelate uptake ABC transporter family permease subunit n=1 Tax=Ornithinibacillus caprae TaxID=2678566 RepID=A0A6N8FHR4_9BACI|nr:iron ABC transporter permease [Ornithinibacillus caprae]MUK88236.1 iron chelate uptake ABC transporter family permease subunit [Ornithinibacillus caprae]
MNVLLKKNNTKKRPIFLGLLFIIGISILTVGIMLSMSIGIADVHFSHIVESFFINDLSKEHLFVQTIRLPRAIIACLIGGNLAVAGAIMQAITRNPLASPQIFGINAGASFFVVLSAVFFTAASPSSVVYFAFLGATIGGVLVYYLGSSGGMTPVKLALAGITIHFFLSALTEGLIIFNEHTTEGVLFWLAGAVDSKSWQDVKIILPWSLLGLLGSLILAKSISVLSLGENVARGLGQNIGLIRLFSGILVVILAGASVSIAGPIGFVGLIVPHITRYIVGVDYRLVLPFSALFGAILLVYADIIARFIAFPYESPVGIVTAILGAPFFFYLIKRRKKLS